MAWGWPVGYYRTRSKSWTQDYQKQIPDSSRDEDLNQGPPDFKSSTLNHSAKPPPQKL